MSVGKILEGSLESVVVAGARDPAKAVALQELSSKFPERLHVIQLDVADEDSTKVGPLRARCGCFMHFRYIFS